MVESVRTFRFAWLANEREAFDPVAHRRLDIGIKSVTVREEESVDAHSCSIVTTRMASADLAGKRWAMLSFSHPDGNLYPVCRMRRRPVPVSEVIGELNLEFDALPSDWMNRRDTVLAGMRVLPFFDPILVASDKQNSPTEILDGYRVVGHFDRVTQEYTTPEMLGLGLPVYTFEAKNLVSQKNGGGVKVRRTQTPIAGVQLDVNAEFTTADDGLIDMSSAVRRAFPEGAVGDSTVGGPSNTLRVPGNTVSTVTPDALENSYPSQGSNVNGASGYTIVEATLRKTATPAGAPAKTGALRGQKARYAYTDDSDLKKPVNMGYDISYYSASLWLSYSLRQKRKEKVSVFIPNGNIAYADGVVETISTSIQDPTVDDSSDPYLPEQNVEVGAHRRVGQYVWSALRAHLTHGPFSQDLYAADGTQQWELLNTNGSVAGTTNLSAYLTTQRGVATVVAAIYKALKKIALSQRSIEVRILVPFEDVAFLTTAWAVRLNISDKKLWGGTAVGKVTGIEISKGAANDFPKAAITFVCCDGGGKPGPDQNHGVNPSGQPWDGITVSQIAGIPGPATPVPGGIVIAQYAPGDQVAYVQARDFTGVAPRNDKTLNDPKHLLTECKTKLVLQCTPISGQPALRLDVGAVASGWSGPAQIVVPTV